MILFVETHYICPMAGNILYNPNPQVAPEDPNNRLLGTYYLRYRWFKVRLPDGTIIFEHRCGEDNTFANEEERQYCFSEAMKEILKHYEDIKDDEA